MLKYFWLCVGFCTSKGKRKGGMNTPPPPILPAIGHNSIPIPTMNEHQLQLYQQQQQQQRLQQQHVQQQHAQMAYQESLRQQHAAAAQQQQQQLALQQQQKEEQQRQQQQPQSSLPSHLFDRSRSIAQRLEYLNPEHLLMLLQMIRVDQPKLFAGLDEVRRCEMLMSANVCMISS